MLLQWPNFCQGSLKFHFISQSKIVMSIGMLTFPPPSPSFLYKSTCHAVNVECYFTLFASCRQWGYDPELKVLLQSIKENSNVKWQNLTTFSDNLSIKCRGLLNFIKLRVPSTLHWHCNTSNIINHFWTLQTICI